MARKRLSMRKIRDVLRLKYSLGRSNREIGAILRISHSTVGSYVRRAREAGVSCPLPDDLDDARLEAALYPPTAPSRVRRPEPDWARVHRELARHKGVTLQRLWFEYREAHPDGYQYSRFCDRYREWRRRLDVVLRQVYRAGEKVFVDYAGPTVEVTDRRTGEIHEAKVFVGVLAVSNHTFVDVTRSRSLPDWTASHVRMFEYWGGVPELVIPDNEKAAVRRASRYEPDVNRTYHDLAVHYGTAVLPARPRSPQDKAKGGGGGPERGAVGSGAVAQPPVLLAVGGPRGGRAPAGGAQRAAVPEDRGQPPQPLRGPGPSSAQAAPGRSLRVRRVAQGAGQHRLPHPGRRPLLQRPSRACPPGGRGPARHNHGRDLPQAPACGRPYPRPRERRIHDRSGAYARRAPRPPRVDPSRLVRWARKTGPRTADFARTLLETRPHPEQGYRSCLGLMRLARAYPAERMEAACRRALDIGAHSYKSVKTILTAGLDQADPGEQRSLSLPTDHAHVRGPDYYANSHNGKET